MPVVHAGLLSGVLSSELIFLELLFLNHHLVFLVLNYHLTDLLTGFRNSELLSGLLCSGKLRPI